MIKVVRQLVRTKYLNAKLDKDLKKFNFDDTCYNFEGVPRQYDCNKLIRTQNKNTHRKRGGFHKRDRFKSRHFRTMRKRPVYNKSSLLDHVRFIRKTGKNLLLVK